MQFSKYKMFLNKMIIFLNDFCWRPKKNLFCLFSKNNDKNKKEFYFATCIKNFLGNGAKKWITNKKKTHMNINKVYCSTLKITRKGKKVFPNREYSTIFFSLVISFKVIWRR